MSEETSTETTTDAAPSMATLATAPANTQAEGAESEGTNNGESQTEVSDWRESLPKELKEQKTFEKFKDVSSLAKSYSELEKVRQVIPDEYKFEKREGMPEDFDEAKFSEQAKELGLTQEQADKMLDGTLEKYNAKVKEKGELDQKITTELKEKYGDKYEEVFDGVRLLLSKEVSEESMKYWDSMPEESLVPLVEAIHTLKTKYIDESKDFPDGSAASKGQSVLENLYAKRKQAAKDGNLIEEQKLSNQIKEHFKNRP